MASRFPLTRFPVTAATATRNRVAHITRRNFAAEAVPEDFVAKRKGVEEHAKCKIRNVIIFILLYLLSNVKFYLNLFLASSDLWKKVSLYVCPIALIASTANAFMIMKQHAQHQHEAHEDHPPFAYQKLRNKVFNSHLNESYILFK